MRLLRDLVVLLSLVAVMFFGAVASASASTSNPDSIGEALAARVARAWVVACSSTFPGWTDATVGDPTTYYSHDDIKSVYEFTVLNGGTGVGYIMVAARKYWGPILEFGTGEAPSRNLVQARKQAGDHGYVILASGRVPLWAPWWRGNSRSARLLLTAGGNGGNTLS